MQERPIERSRDPFSSAERIEEDAQNRGEVVLETPRLQFRRFTMNDAALLVDLDSDPEVMKYISRKPATTHDFVRQKALPRILQEYDQKNKRGFWAVYRTSDNRFAGWFHLRPDALGLPDSELGYRLKREFWGQGFATEGTRALLRMAFDRPGESRVVARTLIQNTASRRVMEKCGMVPLMRFRYPENLLPGFSTEEREAITYFVTRRMVAQRVEGQALFSATHTSS